jgi:DNA-binding beta-propeller fold protein YncE
MIKSVEQGKVIKGRPAGRIGWAAITSIAVCTVSLLGCGGDSIRTTKFGYVTQWSVINPYGLSVEGDFVYVSSYGESTTDGLVSKFAKSGSPISQTQNVLAATSIGIDAGRNLYVGDDGNHHGLCKIGPNGTVIWSKTGITSAGPTGVAVDPSGNIWIVDNEASRVDRLDPNGNVIGGFATIPAFGLRHDGEPNNDVIAIDPKGNIYLTDAPNSRVLIFNLTSPTATGMWTTNFPGAMHPSAPSGIALDGKGNIYVTDTANNCAVEFDVNGTYQRSWGSTGSGVGQFNNPGGIAVDASGDIFVVDNGNQRVQVFGQR